jgi:hypothetical protein
MLCNEFRDLMFERLSGELTPQQDDACSQHEQSCVICRAELAQFRDVQSKLRAGWPSEEPLPIRVVLPGQTPSRNWFDVSALWFSRASAGLVAACLLLLVLVRPAVQVGKSGMQLTFGTAPVQTAQAATPAMTEAQVKAMVQAAVDAELAQAQARPAASKPAAPPADVTQVALQVRQMQRNEATLWQAVQQHGVYLETLWNRTSETPIRPVSLTR